MVGWASQTTDLLWRNGLTAIPLVLLTAAVCRCIPCRPATRHTMWLVVLAWLVTPSLLPEPPMPELVSAWVKPLLAPEVDPSASGALSNPGAFEAGQSPALAIGVLNNEAVRPVPRKPTKSASENPLTLPTDPPSTVGSSDPPGGERDLGPHSK